jgi:hypothetical protein
MTLPSACCGFGENPLPLPVIGGMEGMDEKRRAGKKQALRPFFRCIDKRRQDFSSNVPFLELDYLLKIKLQKRQFSTKIHFVDICPCLKHTNGLIFSSLVVKRSFIGVYMKSSILPRCFGEHPAHEGNRVAHAQRTPV